MKIEVESEALDSLKAMAQRLQDERDELLGELVIINDLFVNGSGSIERNSLIHFHIIDVIAKCTAKPEVM